MLEGFYLVLVSLKAHQVFTAPPPIETGAPYANIGANTSISISINALEYDGGGGSGGGSGSYAIGGTATPTMTPLAGAGAGRRVPASAVAPAVTPQMAAVAPAVGAGGGGGSVVEVTGKLGGGSVGGPCGPRRLALTETVAHLAFLSAMAVRQTDLLGCSVLFCHRLNRCDVLLASFGFWASIRQLDCRMIP